MTFLSTTEGGNVLGAVNNAFYNKLVSLSQVFVQSLKTSLDKAEKNGNI